MLLRDQTRKLMLLRDLLMSGSAEALKRRPIFCIATWPCKVCEVNRIEIEAFSMRSSRPSPRRTSYVAASVLLQDAPSPWQYILLQAIRVKTAKPSIAWNALQDS